MTALGKSELTDAELYRFQFVTGFYRNCLAFTAEKNIAVWAIKNKAAFEMILEIQEDIKHGRLG